MSGLSRTPGKRVYAARRTVSSNLTLSANTSIKTITYDTLSQKHTQIHSQNILLGMRIYRKSMASPTLFSINALIHSFWANTAHPATKVTNLR